MLPMVAITLPLTPLRRKPVNMDILTAMSPGAVWARVMSSANSSSVSHLRCTISFCMREIIAYPPPMVNAPIFANTPNS